MLLLIGTIDAEVSGGVRLLRFPEAYRHPRLFRLYFEARPWRWRLLGFACLGGGQLIRRYAVAGQNRLIRQFRQCAAGDQATDQADDSALFTAHCFTSLALTTVPRALAPAALLALNR